MDDLRPRVVDGLTTLAPKVLRSILVDRVTEGTRLREELGMTSASTLELLLELEDSLGIEVDVEDLDEANVESVGALADYIVAHARLADG